MEQDLRELSIKNSIISKPHKKNEGKRTIPDIKSLEEFMSATCRTKWAKGSLSARRKNEIRLKNGLTQSNEEHWKQ